MIQAQILRLIEQLVSEQDLGLIMISHDLAVLSDTCDRLAVMYAGRVVEEGPARQVYEDARHPYGQALSAAFPRIGDTGVAVRAARPAGRPAGPVGAADRLYVPSALPGGAGLAAPRRTRRCGTAGTGRRAACVHVGRRPWTGTSEEHRHDDDPTVPPAPQDHPYRLPCSAPRACTSPSPAGAAPTPRVPSTASTSTSGPARSSPWSASRAAARRRWPARCSAWSRRPRAASPSTGSPSTTPRAPSRRTASASSWSSRTRAARSTPGTRCTTRWPRACASTGTAGDEREAVAEALSRAGLRPPERFFLRYPHELSGGQRQRVVIAGALVLEPELIVADEPVASLDASVRGEILALLLRLRDELGLSALVVTHDLGLAWNIADRVAVMYLGRIVETGDGGGGPDGASTPVHPGPVVGPAGGAGRPGRPDRRAPGPVPHPRPAAASTPAARSWRRARRNGRAWRTRAGGGPGGARRGRRSTGGVPLGDGVGSRSGPAWAPGAL